MHEALKGIAWWSTKWVENYEISRFTFQQKQKNYAITVRVLLGGSKHMVEKLRCVQVVSDITDINKRFEL